MGHTSCVARLFRRSEAGLHRKKKRMLESGALGKLTEGEFVRAAGISSVVHSCLVDNTERPRSSGCHPPSGEARASQSSLSRPLITQLSSQKTYVLGRVAGSAISERLPKLGRPENLRDNNHRFEVPVTIQPDSPPIQMAVGWDPLYCGIAQLRRSGER